MRNATWAMVTCLLIAGCGRYDGHNGRFFAWQDFDSEFLVAADENKDGQTTTAEFLAYRLAWLRGHRLACREGFSDVRDERGNPVSAGELAEMFRRE